MATFTDWIDHTDQGSTPATPGTGVTRVFTKADGLYVVDDAAGVTGPMIDAGAVGNYTGVPWSSGTSMPVSPSTNDRVTRTDLLGGSDWKYDGTRWRSVQTFISSFQMTDTVMFSGISATVNPIGRLLLPYKGTYTIWALVVDLGTFVSTTNDGTKNWTFAFATVPSGNAVGAGLTTASDTASTHTYHEMAINALLTGTDVYLSVTATKVSTPGNLIVTGGKLVYQLVAT
jgi:hypothetical protein